MDWRYSCGSYNQSPLAWRKTRTENRIDGHTPVESPDIDSGDEGRDETDEEIDEWNDEYEHRPHSSEVYT